MNDKIPLNKHVNLVSIFIFLILTLANAILKSRSFERLLHERSWITPLEKPQNPRP